MTKINLCLFHGQHYEKHNSSKWKLVKPEKCSLCIMEKTFDSVLDLPETY